MTVKDKHIYPATHWVELEKFLIGDTCDPKGCFRLCDDLWEAWPYSATSLPTLRSRFRFNFANLRSVIKLYVKSYCYQRLVGSSRPLSWYAARLPITIQLADDFIRSHNFNSLDEISSPEVFAELWTNQLVAYTDSEGNILSVSNWRQNATRPFWLDMAGRFGCPYHVPPKKHSKRTHPTATSADMNKILPVEVIRQFDNKLALHRDGRQRLNRYHHLRLCVLMLVVCTGRRIDEILKAERGSGPDGPLRRHPSASGTPNGSLWFRFHPNKEGPRDEVYISPEWEDLTSYCVRELIRYGDEIRQWASVDERELLILTSGWNWTRYGPARNCAITNDRIDFNTHTAAGEQRLPEALKQQPRVSALTYISMREWLYSRHFPDGTFRPGVLEEWRITKDGSTKGEIYRLTFLQARHTRQSALSSDPDIPVLIMQRDLNHRKSVTQLAYQHNLAEQHVTLKAKVRGGELVGNGLTWLQRIVGINQPAESLLHGHELGTPILLDEHWRALIENNPLFIQFNRVPCGYCTLPQGPAACPEYMNCTEAEDGGCRYFITDPSNPRMVDELNDRACGHRHRQQESLAKGQTVKAGRYEVLASRTESLKERALVMIEGLKKRVN